MLKDLCLSNISELSDNFLTRSVVNNHTVSEVPDITSLVMSGTSDKPAQGWLHPDHLVASDGLNYVVRYIGEA